MVSGDQRGPITLLAILSAVADFVSADSVIRADQLFYFISVILSLTPLALIIPYKWCAARALRSSHQERSEAPCATCRER